MLYFHTSIVNNIYSIFLCLYFSFLIVYSRLHPNYLYSFFLYGIIHYRRHIF